MIIGIPEGTGGRRTRAETGAAHLREGELLDEALLAESGRRLADRAVAAHT